GAVRRKLRVGSISRLGLVELPFARGCFAGEGGMPSITGGHHIALTVTDADRSAEWYSGLLGMSVLAAGDDETVRVRVLVDAASGWLLGLRQYHGREGDGFDEFRTGLDHFAFGVENRAALEEWERELS